jgi:aryl-alcohol dehydrogenase-like predicted oxidoreductase
VAAAHGTVAGIGFPVCRIVVGGAPLHAHAWTSRAEIARQCRHLDGCLQAGCNAIDTARVYGGSERLVGHWLRTGVDRTQVAIITKCAHPPIHDMRRNRLTPDEITRDLERSLTALQTDYVDVLLFHRDHAGADHRALLDCVTRLREAGRIRAWGLSNWATPRIQALTAAASTHGVAGPALASSHYSVLEWAGRPPWPGCESVAGAAGSDARAWFRRSGLPLFAWSPLGGGVASAAARGTRRLPRHYDVDVNRQRLATLAQLARARGISPAQLALTFIAGQGLDVYAVTSSSDVAHVAASVAAMSMTVSAEERMLLGLEVPSSPARNGDTARPGAAA